MEFGTVYGLIDLFQKYGITDVIISPGSRSAPLTLSFTRNPGFNTYVIPDERSGGYIALGMALSSGKPVILVCTSGTAVFNYGSPVAEAFYQKIPLIVLTADRPPEWIDQSDGQTIHQSGIFGDNIKWDADIPVDLRHSDAQWHARRLITEGINLSTSSPAGPIHLNFPFREPLYPDNQNETVAETGYHVAFLSKTISDFPEEEWESLGQTWNTCRNILIVPGQGGYSPDLIGKLRTAALHFRLPVACDIIANLNGEPEPFIYKHDLFINGSPSGMPPYLYPDLVISFGNSILAKNLKILLRHARPANHWHIQDAVKAPDTFQSLSRILRIDPGNFFGKMVSQFGKNNINQSFAAEWIKKDKQTAGILKNYFPRDQFSELEAVKIILESLPNHCNLHLANSLPVRLANYIGISGRDIRVYSNRGTSGIDGCLSTAVGASINSDRMNFLITGDMAFFYDRNALWHNYKVPNLKIIILNNHGGGIFRMIDGLSGIPELEEYFETRQTLTAERTANDYNLQYFAAGNTESLKKILPGFLKAGGPSSILEIPTDSQMNYAVFMDLKSDILKIWN